MLGIRTTLLAGALNAIVLTGVTVPSPVAAAPASYTVEAGDTLFGIAREHRITLGALLKANGLTVNSLILPGQRLTIPGGAKATTATPPPAAATAPRSSGSYVIVAGDTLSGIAARHRVGLGALLSTNRLTVNSLILPGMKLALPAGAIAPAKPATTSTGSAAAPSPRTSRASTRLGAVVDYAMAQQGKPYRFFSAGPDAFDCSGLTKAAFAQAGITLVHQSAAQARQGRAVDLTREEIRPGDLVFLSTRGSARINHVGIAISSTRWIHAVGTGKVVSVGWIPADAMITAVRRFDLG
jgi:peptidoglycan endopeptidase LytE